MQIKATIRYPYRFPGIAEITKTGKTKICYIGKETRATSSKYSQWKYKMA